VPLPMTMAIPGFLNDLARQASDLGWSLADLETRAGLPAGYLDAVGRLQRPPTRAACDRLAAALKTDPARLSPWLGPQTLAVGRPGIVGELQATIYFLELLPESARQRAAAAAHAAVLDLLDQVAQVNAAQEAEAGG